MRHVQAVNRFFINAALLSISMLTRLSSHVSAQAEDQAVGDPGQSLEEIEMEVTKTTDVPVTTHTDVKVPTDTWKELYLAEDQDPPVTGTFKYEASESTY